MSTFAKANFKALIYSATRPTYPRELFRFVYDYHQRRNDPAKGLGWETAVDLGCGTGQATQELHNFTNVIGVDPSPKMVETAQAQFESQTIGRPGQFQFRTGKAENLKGVIDDKSVDLVIAAQASHWFDWKKVWPEVNRILKPNGTAAFWIYSELRFTKHPALTPLITEFAQGTNPKTSVGPHFQRPGRTILENHLQDVPAPSEILQSAELTDFQRVYFTGGHYSLLPASQTRKVIMRKEMNWVQILGYLRSWSALHTYHELYPEDLPAPLDSRFLEDDAELSKVAGYLLGLSDSTHPHGGNDALLNENTEAVLQDLRIRSGDIAVRFWKDLREGVRAGNGKWDLGDNVEVEWPVALLLASRAP
ncbi:hypothetical protein AX16_010896 [Volvariella volvacea WC 439]|nr:hypothetical protein AX16_010896 [Volvariella volvacea WC 439]